MLKKVIEISKDIFPAHIKSDTDEFQPVSVHCRNTARFAADNLRLLNLEHCGELLGLLHDGGKYSDAFHRYIEKSASGEQVRRGSVNHSSFGLRYVLEHFYSGQYSYDDISAELLAYAIGAHHGLFDCVDDNYVEESMEDGFFRRSLQADEFEIVKNRFSEFCTSDEIIGELFNKAVEELKCCLEKITGQQENSAEYCEIYFYIGLLERLLLSALIDADRRDTAEFMQGCVFPSNTDIHWTQCLERVEKKIFALEQNTPIQKARRSISDSCALFAQEPCGIYRLNVPTGGGKTLSSLRYALTHAQKWKKHRIVFAVPLLSILDQNATEIRRYVEDDSMVLEHHSNLIREKESGDELNLMELMIDTWQAPIIITTLVQLLNTLFSGKSSCIRRFQALSDSVIVIDEVQTVPRQMLTIFNLTMNFLSEICGATIVLCSATQPAFEYAKHPIHISDKQMVPYNQELWEIFHRTDVEYSGARKKEQLSSLVLDVLKEAGSVLVVCNQKEEASTLFGLLLSEQVNCFHLSASMCIQHRRDTLNQIKNALEQTKEKSGEKVIVVSTQVIEAGVDISFARVIRLCAGMDSVVQSAGRCNRNGESDTPAKVRIVNCTDESLVHLQDIATEKQKTLDLISEFENNNDRFDRCLTSEKAIRWYYTQLYDSMKEGAQDYPAKSGTLFDLMGRNEVFCKDGHRMLLAAFKTAGEQFKVFDTETTTVLVPYEAGREYIERLILLDKAFDKDYSQIAQCVECLKPYSVSIYEYDKKRLEKEGALMELFDGAVTILLDGFYDKQIGLLKKSAFMEV